MKWNIGKPYELTQPSPILQILSDRGIDPGSFFHTGADTLHDPFLLKDMTEATQLTLRHIQEGHHIRIAGDYDADGITSTYVMLHGLALMQAHTSYAIPHRKEGYGLSIEMVDAAHRDGVQLIITCDNGIASIDAVNHAKGIGIDVIITDHHEPQETLPATLVVNPKRADCPYPFKELAGCGVAWKFIHALLSYQNLQDHAFDLMEMVAIGTVADMMDLIGENRSFAAMGLDSLRAPMNPGLLRLMEELDAFKYPITADTIGFSIGPALNATGRLSHAHHAVDLLLGISPIEHLRLSGYIKGLNDERKKWTDEYAEKVVASVQETNDKVIVHQVAGLPEGITGIVASRLLREYGRPVLLVTPSLNGRHVKGSGRSVPGFDLFQAMTGMKDVLLHFGGHEQACGFSLLPENVPELRQRLNAVCALDLEALESALDVDYAIEAHHLDLQMAENFQLLEPTGRGNPKPVFALTDCLVSQHRFIGGNKKTLKLSLISGNTPIAAIGFNLADRFEALQPELDPNEPYIDVAGVLSVNEWQGRKTLQLELKDLRPSGRV